MTPGASWSNAGGARWIHHSTAIRRAVPVNVSAALDVVAEEPLPQDSPLWDMPQVLITPHTAGETHSYEDNVLDMMMENIERLWRGEQALFNQIV